MATSLYSRKFSQLLASKMDVPLVTWIRMVSRKRWNQFKRDLNDLDLTDEEQESCLGVARHLSNVHGNFWVYIQAV